MVELLKIVAIQRALLAILVAGIFLPLVGSFSVLSGTSFIAAGFSHIAFAGVALAYLVNVNPLLSSVLITGMAAYLLWNLSEKGGVKYEQTLSILFSFSTALGIVFFGLTKTYISDAMSYLFGSPLTVNVSDLVLLIISMFLYCFFIIFYRRELFLMLFSEELAQASGFDTSGLRLLFYLFTALAVVFSMKSVGALVVFGLIIIPPSLAQRFAKHVWQMLGLSIVIGFICGLIGFLVSLLLDIPVGATVVIFGGLLYALSFIIRK